MKKLHICPGVALCAVTVLLGACAATQTDKTAVALPRFHEEASCDVIVQFPGWSAIVISKPNTDEGNFTSLFTRHEAEARLAELPVHHNLAVVACELSYPEEEQAEQQQTSGSHLKKLGFQRLVFVSGQRRHTVDCACVIKEMMLTDKPGA